MASDISEILVVLPDDLPWLLRVLEAGLATNDEQGDMDPCRDYLEGWIEDCRQKIADEEKENGNG